MSKKAKSSSAAASKAAEACPAPAPPVERVTAIYLDGNTLMAAVVSLGERGKPIVHALRLIETEDLVERVDRIPHPIFMNAEHMVFPAPDILSQALGVLLEVEEFRNPIVGVVPSDLVDSWTDESTCPSGEQRKRLGAGVRAVLDGNPYGYPKLLSFDLKKEGTNGGQPRVRLWSCRFDDVLSIADQLLRLELPFLGLVTGQRALTEVLQELHAAHSDAPIIVIDIGKLRTTYVGMSAADHTFAHAIPVGLARDDNRYFSSFVPTLHGVCELSEDLGGLLIPADYTPVGLFEPYGASPQMEITRFASNVAEYASRLLINLRSPEGEPVVVALGGLAAGLPGLREYLENRTAAVIETIGEKDEMPWQCADAEMARRTRSFLPAIGGGLAFLRRAESGFGIIMRERRPKRFQLSGGKMPSLEPEAVYVMEWGRQG